MSTGMLIGGGLGAVIGFAIGGPYGAYIGFTIGWGVGAMIDPLTPDIPSPGQPELGNLNISTADEGPPIKDILGTTKIASGNIIWYCCQRVVEVKEEVETGGKGGTEEVTTGWKHYVSWALGLCMGPIDTLYTVYNGDDVVWSGELNRPATGGEETIVLTGMGSMTFYFGTDDQVANTVIGSKLADSTLNIPYRHLCWAFFNDCHIGKYERMPTMKFVLQKSPVFSFNANNIIGTYDYNPAHAMYYILNTLLEIPIAYLDGADSFSDVADTLFAEERGISILFGSQSAAITYLGESILPHIDGMIRWGNDGKFHPKLIRADEAVVDLPSFDENQILDTLAMERRSWYDTINEVKVQYSERFYRDPPPPPSEGQITFCDSWRFENVWDMGTLACVPISIGENSTTLLVQLSKFVGNMHDLKLVTFSITLPDGAIVESIIDSEIPANKKTANITKIVSTGTPNIFFVGGYDNVAGEAGFYSVITAGGMISAYPSDYIAGGAGYIQIVGPNLEGTSINCAAYHSGAPGAGGTTYLATYAASAVIALIDTYHFGKYLDTLDFAWSFAGDILVVASKEDDFPYGGDEDRGKVRTFSISGAGAIGSLLDTWQFHDTGCRYMPQVIRMQSNIYTLIYPTLGGSQYIKTFSIDGAGAITGIDSATVAGNGDCTLCKIDSNTILIQDYIYATFKYHLKTYRIDTDGMIGAELDSYESSTPMGQPVHVGRNNYVMTYLHTGATFNKAGYCSTWKIE